MVYQILARRDTLVCREGVGREEVVGVIMRLLVVQIPVASWPRLKLLRIDEIGDGGPLIQRSHDGHHAAMRHSMIKTPRILRPLVLREGQQGCEGHYSSRGRKGRGSLDRLCLASLDTRSLAS